MTIRAKIIASFLLVISLFISVSLWSHQRQKRAAQRLEWVNRLFLPLSRQITQLQGQLHGLTEDMRKNYFSPANEPETSTFGRVVRDLYPYIVQKRFVTMERLLEGQTSREPKLVGELSEMLNKAKKTFVEATTAKDRMEFEGHISSVRNQLLTLSKRVDDECQTIITAAQTEGRETLISSLSLSVLVVVFSLFTLFASYRVLNPLPALISTVKKLRDGDLDHSFKVKASAKDEVALLAREYNRMLEALRDRDKKIITQQAELLQSERLATVGQLSAEIVHEIRNPLNSMNLNIDWLKAELKDVDAEVKKTLQSISREIERLHQITESYLLRSRVPVKESERAPINEIWNEIIEFEKGSGENGVEIETYFSPTELFVWTDRARLKQAFLNLLKNSKEAMPRGGHIRVRTELKDNVSIVSVADTGHGMTDRTRRQTFLPFFTTKPNGTGLGLMLTKEIVEAARGSISCDSQLGKGTLFTLQFPV